MTTFFERLKQDSDEAKVHVFTAPIIQRCFAGDFTVDDYVAFLCQAYHHVRFTVPLLMGVGSRLSAEQEWLRVAIGEYIEEETGHQEWILNDIAACGYDKELARQSLPNPSTELMVSYAWDMVQRVNPLGFFGMVHVLEGTSITLADKAADMISSTLGLPRNAFTYLYSHGSLDQDHVKFFEDLMNRISDEKDQEQIVHAARMFYRLYGDVFRELSPKHGLAKAA